jgi:hypothetical protein
MKTEKRTFSAPYESPRSEVVEIKPFNQFLQGSNEDIGDGGEINWVMEEPERESLWERLGLGF